MKLILLFLAFSFGALADNRLMNGEVVAPDYAAVVSVRSSTGACTATIVGPRALILAAHCVPQGGGISFNVGVGFYQAWCERHPAYTIGTPHDIAMCLATANLPPVPYEHVNATPGLYGWNSWVTLTGYGRTTWTGPVDGKLRHGMAVVTAPANPTMPYFILRGGAALAPGDSGGPVFGRAANNQRYIIGINSGSIDKAIHSICPDTASSSAFIRDWSIRKAAPVCGLTGATGCRPAPTGEFYIDVPTAGGISGKMKPGKEHLWLAARDRVFQVLNVLNGL